MHESRLRAALARHLGESPGRLPIGWSTLAQPNGYRRRIRLSIFDAARVGFFNTAKSVDCSVLTESLRGILHRLLDTSSRYTSALGALQHIELREPDADHVASAYIVKRDAEKPIDNQTIEQLGQWLDGMNWFIAGTARETPRQRLWLPTVWQWVPIGSFLQVNQAINSMLVGDLVAGAKQRGLSSFCDLYAGSGNFSLPLLANGLHGHAVELDLEAGRAASAAANAQDLTHAEFEHGDAGAFAVLALSPKRSFDLVIVDPPRAGIRNNLASMASLARSHFVYCSCNPDTLARDLAVLCLSNFEIQTIHLYDMFANTAHVECVVWLRALNRASH